MRSDTIVAPSVTIATETWTTRKGIVAKAVVRDSKGRFDGRTNQTKAVDWVYLVFGF